MIKVSFTPSFLRQIKALSPEIQEDIFEKTELFKNPKNHIKLKVHKLKGRLKNRLSFSVNYRFRIVFSYLTKKETVFLAVGDHDIYKM